MTTTSKAIRIATRRSPLALAQAEMVRIALLAADPSLEPHQVELLPMTTTGDRNPQKNLPEWGYKGLFTKELEELLISGGADIAVHSMKDMPSILPEGLIIAGMLEREDPHDAFISLNYQDISNLPQGARIGSSSIRRSAMLKHLRPDLDIVPFRGNVGTRMEKLSRGDATATILAVAGLNRLGLAQHITQILPIETMLPAVAQGAIGIECREKDETMRAQIAAISHQLTQIAVTAERALLATLDGSCRTPLGGYATLKNNDIHLQARLLHPDTLQEWSGDITGHVGDALRLGQNLGQELRARAEREGFIL